MANSLEKVIFVSTFVFASLEEATAFRGGDLSNQTMFEVTFLDGSGPVVQRGEDGVDREGAYFVFRYDMPKDEPVAGFRTRDEASAFIKRHNGFGKEEAYHYYRWYPIIIDSGVVRLLPEPEYDY